MLDDSSDYVYIGSKLTSVADAIDARAKEKPGSQLKVLYHDIKDDPRDDMPGHQKRIQKQRMVWKPEPSPVKVEADSTDSVKMDYKHFAGSIETKKWNTDKCCVVWTVKWSTVGLAPVRPQVMLLKDVEIAPKTAIELVSSV